MKTGIGIDPGTHVCGWAIFIDGKYITAGHWKAKGDIVERLKTMLDHATALIMQYDCDVACEKTWGYGYQPAPELSTFIRALRGWVKRRKRKFFLYNVSTIWGKAIRHKDVARAAIRQEVGDLELSDDAVDAIAVGWHHLAMLKIEEMKGE